MLNILLPAVYSGSFGLQTLPDIFQGLHAFLCSAPIDIHLQQHNQDFVVCFTSLPIEQIMESVHHLATQIGQIFHSLYSWTEPRLRVFQGQFKKHKIKTGVIWLKDLCQLCELSLHTSLFSHMKKVRFLILSPTLLSPTWSISGIKNRKMLWKSIQMNYTLSDVDNRLVLCGQHLADRWFMEEFLADFFYRHPVELEDVTNGELLGTILGANLRTLSFQQPAASFQFRPFRSAATEAHKLSAVAARTCLASRYFFPDQQARSDVQQLVKSYLEYDYPATKLKQLATKFLQIRC